MNYMNNLSGLFNTLQGMLMNPAPILAKMGVPATALQNPQQAVQELVSSGRMSQEQFNNYRQMAIQLQNMPQFRQYFGN